MITKLVNPKMLGITKMASFFGIFLVSTIAAIPAYAESGDYGKSYVTIFHTPNICTVEFANDWVIESTVKEFTEQARISTQEWEVKLKAQESRKNQHLWDIDYTFVPQDQKDTFDYTKCDIIIQFQDKPENPNDYYAVLGYAETKNEQTIITIYYAQIATCQTEDAKYFYYDPCYFDHPRTPTQIGSIIRHELGHAFGLGHYYSENESVNLNWAKGNTPSPSVMVIFSSDNAKLQQIRDIDVTELHSIYGSYGFKSGSLQEIAESKLTEEKTANQTITNEKIIISIPDWMKKNAQTWSTGQGDDQMIFGVVEYLQIQNVLEYQQIPEGLATPEKKIPQWYKNIADWWSSGLISDQEFTNGLEFLLDKKIIIV